MSSVSRPYGFRSVKATGGLPFASATVMLPIASGYATAIGFGDVVKIISDGTLQKETGTTSVTATGVIGIFYGVSYADAALGTVFRVGWPASTVTANAKAYVCDDPSAVFQIQADGVIAATALGTNGAIVQTAVAGNGQSRVALASATINTTNTLPLRIVGFVSGPDSVAGDAYTDVLVRWNFGMHAYHLPTGI